MLENYSVAWDLDGLPARIVLYHGELDVSFPVAQVISFKDSLASEGVKVDLFTLPKVGHSFGVKHHRRVLKVLTGKL